MAESTAGGVEGGVARAAHATGVAFRKVFGIVSAPWTEEATGRTRTAPQQQDVLSPPAATRTATAALSGTR